MKQNVFLQNFTVQYVNKLVVNVKVKCHWKLLSFCQKNGQETGTNLLYNLTCDIVLWTELITKKGFLGKTTCPASLNWVLSLNVQTTT